MYVSDYLNKTVRFVAPSQNPVPFFFLGSWKKYNNSVGKVSPYLDGNSIHDKRVPVFFDMYRLNIPIKYLYILDNTDSFKYLTIANHKHAHWICHLKNNFEMLKIETKDLFVCAADQKIENVAQKMGLNVAFWTKRPKLTSQIAPFGSSLFRKISLFKQNCLWGMLDVIRENEYFVFLDADVTLIQRPTTSDFDIEIMDDSPPLALSTELNIGFLILRNTIATRKLKDIYMSFLQKHVEQNDQKIVNDVIRIYSKKIGLKLNTLNPNLYINGYRYYEDKESSVDFDSLIAIHHNWISSDDAKWDRTMKWNAIVKNSTMNYQSFILKLKQTWLYSPRFVYKPHIRKMKSQTKMCT